MWYKIKQGRHRAYPFNLGIHFGKTSESYEVMFDDSCRYQLEGVDQLDWNKLVGWSYGFHHNNSIRIGWGFIPELDKIQLALYTYENGIREVVETSLNTDKIELDFNKTYTLKLGITLAGTAYLILCNFNNEWEINLVKRTSRYKPTLGYNLNTYFGGNLKSPVNLKIYLMKL
jgi:hypothetical protein